MRSQIIAIGGQTASGKSGLAIEIAKKFNGEIINADSRQVYKYLDIGTAKEKVESKNSANSVVIQGIVHHLIDIFEPNQEFNLARFQDLANTSIKKIHQKGKIPILVGGTGLYLDSIVFNYNLIKSPTNQKLRNNLQKKSVNELQEILKEKDLNIFKRLNNSDQNNPHRLIRTLEKLENPKQEEKFQSKTKYQSLYMAPLLDSDSLNKRIDQRVENMFQEGLEAENKKLRDQGFSTQNSSLKSIGYQEFDEYFNKKQTLEETKELIKLHTKQYAKRQNTWFKRHKEIVWIKSPEEAIKVTENFLKP